MRLGGLTVLTLSVSGFFFAILDVIVCELWTDHVTPVLAEMPKATRTQWRLVAMVAAVALVGLFGLADHVLGDKAAGATGHASGEKPADPLPVAPHQRRVQLGR